MCKCKVLVHHLKSQIYILTLQLQSQQNYITPWWWVGKQIPGLFNQEHLEDQTQTLQQCKRYWLEVPDLCGSLFNMPDSVLQCSAG